MKDNTSNLLYHSNDNLYMIEYNTLLVRAKFVDKYDDSITTKSFILDLSDDESENDKTVKDVLSVYADKFNSYILEYRVLTDDNTNCNFKTLYHEN